MPDTITVTPLYTGLLALLFLYLSARVVFRRYGAGVSIGDGNDKDLQKRIRVQANFAEYTPIALILLAVAGLQGAPLMVLHFLGLTLLLGRCIHAIGLSRTPQLISARRAGMYSTVGMIVITALSNIVHAVF